MTNNASTWLITCNFVLHPALVSWYSVNFQQLAVYASIIEYQPQVRLQVRRGSFDCCNRPSIQGDGSQRFRGLRRLNTNLILRRVVCTCASSFECLMALESCA